MDVQEQELAPHVSVFVEALGLPGSPARSCRNPGRSRRTCANQGSSGGSPAPGARSRDRSGPEARPCPGVQQLLANGLVGEQVVPVDVLGPDHVRDVVAHEPQQVPESLGGGAALGGLHPAHLQLLAQALELPEQFGLAHVFGMHARASTVSGRAIRSGILR